MKELLPKKLLFNKYNCMEKLITVKNEYNSLDKLYTLLKKQITYECSKEYDKWDQRIDNKGQMSKCIVLKKNKMNGIKFYFTKSNKLKINHIIPNTTMNAYFGKSVKRHRNIIEIVVGKVKDIVLANSQQKAFNELTQLITKATS